MSWAGLDEIFLSTSLASYLDSACERVIVGDLFCDIPLGLYDPEKEELPSHMTCVSAQEIRKAQKAEREATDLKGSMRKRMEFLDLE